MSQAAARNHVSLERKDAPALPKDIADKIDAFMAASKAANEKNDQRLDNLSKKFDDVVTKDEQKKIDAAMDELKSAVNAEIAALKRAAKGSNSGDVNEIDAKIDRLRQFERKGWDHWARKGDERPLQAAHALALNDEYKQLCAAFNEREGLELKDLSTVIADSGGFLVDPERELRMIEIVEEISDIRQIANVTTIGTKELEVPVDQGGWVASWINELGARATTATGTVTKRKFVAEEIYALPKTTLAMLEDGEIDIEAFITKKATKAIAKAEGAAFVSGDGNQKPKGFLAQTLVANASWAWGKIGYFVTGTSGDFGPSYPGAASGPTAAANGADVLFDVVYGLPRVYRGNCAWVMNRKTLAKVRKLKDGDGQYLFRDALTEGGIITQLLGYPVLEAEDMPDVAANAHAIAFGDFEEGYHIVDRVGIQVRRDEITAPGFVTFHFRRRVGGDVEDFQAIKTLKFGTS